MQNQEVRTNIELTAIAWPMTVLAFLVTTGRFVIRYRSSKPFIASDYINGLAFVFLVAYMAVYQYSLKNTTALLLWSDGLGPAVSDDVMIAYFKTTFATSELFFIVLYLVKASFLMLYYALFKTSVRFKQMWWIVTVSTTICFLITFLSILWMCGYDPAHDLFQPDQCLSDSAINNMLNNIILQSALNVTSDLLIIILPIPTLYSLKMSLMNKLGLALIFSVALIDVAFDITRAVYSFYGGGPLWNILEPPIAVIVCAMPTYRHIRALYTKKSHKYESGASLTPQSSNQNQRTECTEQHDAGRSVASFSPSIHLPTSSHNVNNILVERTYEIRTEAPHNVTYMV